MQLKSGIDDEGIIQYYCANVPWRIIDITLSFKKAVHDAICDELKLCRLFRLAIWFRHISKYIKENASNPDQVNTAAYFLRDIVSTLCNMISAEKSINVKNAIGNITFYFAPKFPSVFSFFKNSMQFFFTKFQANISINFATIFCCRVWICLSRI